MTVGVGSSIFVKLVSLTTGADGAGATLTIGGFGVEFLNKSAHELTTGLAGLADISESDLLDLELSFLERTSTSLWIEFELPDESLAGRAVSVEALPSLFSLVTTDLVS